MICCIHGIGTKSRPAWYDQVKHTYNRQAYEIIWEGKADEHIKSRTWLGDWFLDVQSIAIEEVRNHVESGIRSYLKVMSDKNPLPMILAHSQGTWLAYEALKRIETDRQIKFVTCGSPLRKTRQNLRKPKSVRHWYNFWSWGDLITSNLLIGRSGAIEAADINYHSWHPHSMRHYLSKHHDDLKDIVMDG